MGDTNLMFIANQLKRMYRLNHILVYPLIQLSAYSKDFLRELLKSVLKKYLSEEIEYLNDTFCETGHGRKTLQKIINSFDKRTRGANDNSNNNNSCNNNSYNNNTNKHHKQLPFVGYSKLDQKPKNK